MPDGDLMGRLTSTLTALCSLALGASATAGQFYLFPVKEIEGVSSQARANYPLLDQRVMSALFDGPTGEQVQRQLIAQFVTRLNEAYPASLVHPRQVYDVKIGSGHRFVNDDSLQCKSTPSVAVGDTYAVMLGITRASIYEVVKGANVEVLIPLTLNIQFVRPSLGKVVYTLSETVYSPFRLERKEYESGAANQVIRDTLIRNISAQAASLVTAAKQAFDPKDVSVKLAARDGQFYVTDRGAEVGFAKGEQVEARDVTGKEYVFNVLYADSGYAVIRPAAGSVSVGDNLKFIFEGAADASSKPRIMPVFPRQGHSPETTAVADLFAKDIGFKATFQLDPVDVNFAQTKEMVTRAANCVTWQNVTGMAESTRGKKDAPDYFLRFTPVVSPPVTLAGTGGTKTAEMFHTLVAAQVVDHFGRVIYSGLGDDNYTIERVNGQGLSFAQAKEISLKNATGKLAQNFVANVRFAPRDYKIVRVDKDRVWAGGLAGMSLNDKITFDVLHPLDAIVGGKTALLDLEASSGPGALAAEGDLVGFSYSAVNPALPRPRNGDLLRLYTEVPPNATRVVDCDEADYIGQNNVADASYFAPIVRHAVYQSKKFAAHVGGQNFYADTNALLHQGLFNLHLERPTSDLCSQPGYAVREEALQCDDQQSCKATVTVGIVARMKKDGQVQKTFSSGLRSEFSGVPSLSRNAFYGYRELANGLSMQADLINKLNSN
jgi:hypothetical protein